MRTNKTGYNLMLSRKNQLARRHLDKRFTALGDISKFAAPTKGWMRAIREALGMTAAQLGVRLGARAQSVFDLERSEALGTIQLNSLRKVAEALDCTVVYALVPNTLLSEGVARRARRLAEQELGRIGHTMGLEAQGVQDEDFEDRVERYIKESLRDRDLWNQE